MAAFITPPMQGDDVRNLWRKVEECTDMLNALSNMTCIIEGQVHMLGRLDVSGGSSTLTIKDNHEVNN